MLASRRYADHFSIGLEAGPAAPTYTVELVVSMEGETASSFTIKRGNDEHSFPFLGDYTEENVGYIASIFASLWNSFTDVFSNGIASPAEFLDSLPAEVLLQSVPGLVPAQINALVPVGGAVKSNGNLIVAFGSIAVEMDQNLRVVGTIGRELLDKGKDVSDIRETLRSEGIDFLLINHRFFLKEDSADLTPGRTIRLRSHFDDIQQKGLLRKKGQWGVVVLYEVT